MSSLLASLKPYYYYLIGEGIKKIEVRKTYPKADHWDRAVSFYMSKDEKSFAKIPKEFQEKYRKHFGKVGMRFVCDRIDEYTLKEFEWEKGDITLEYHIPTIEGENTCLEYDEVREYGNGKPLYFWHISNLVIYDKPKELGEFIVPSKIGCCNEGKCRGCKFLDRGNGFNVEDDCNAKFCTDEYKPLRKAPQSWCYVEELGV